MANDNKVALEEHIYFPELKLDYIFVTCDMKLRALITRIQKLSKESTGGNQAIWYPAEVNIYSEREMRGAF